MERSDPDRHPVLVCTPAMGQSQPSHKDNSLPSTNFSADGTVDRSGLPKPAPGFANAAAAPGKGEALLLTGDPVRGIPPCQGCHGAEAGGPSISTGPYAAYPSLRGQYAPYLIARLTSFHKNLSHDTTNDFIMGGVAQTLDDESIQAIAAWLSSLTLAGSTL
jgi:cytochrome c553